MNHSATKSTVPAAELQQALLRVLKSLVFRDGPPAALAELPLSQMRCAYVIAEHEGEKMQDLAHRMQVTLPALSQIVDRLVKRGLVERRADPEDRRISRLHPSESMRSLIRSGNDTRQERTQRIIGRMRPQDVESAIAAINRVASAAEEAETLEAHVNTEGDSEPLVELMSQRARAIKQNATAGLSPRAAESGQ